MSCGSGRYVLLGLLSSCQLFVKSANHQYATHRLYEAVVTTPFLCILSVAFFLGYKPSLRKEIYKQAWQWKGTELKVWGPKYGVTQPS